MVEHLKYNDFCMQPKYLDTRRISNYKEHLISDSLDMSNTGLQCLNMSII